MAATHGPDCLSRRSCWADGAASYPKAEQWAKTAASFILKLGPKQNGQSVSVGGFED